MMNGPQTTEWERAGFGLWRRLNGVVLRVKERNGEVEAEVDGRKLSDTSPMLWCRGLDETTAKQWCEKWANIVVRELT